MEDIVGRLRYPLVEIGAPDLSPRLDTEATKALMREAADEIERLRSLAGAVTPGPTAAETFAPLRHKTPDLQQAVTTAVALHWPSDGA